MKNFNKLFLLTAAIALTMTACDNGDDPIVFEDPTISVVNASSLEQKPGESLTVNVSVFADAKIAKIEAAYGEETEDVTASLADAQSGVASFEFTVPDDAQEGDEFEITFTVTDKQSPAKTATAVATVVTAEVPIETILVSPSANGTGTTTWKSNYIVILEGFIYVNSGQTLTIEPGCVIKGKNGTAEEASALIVAKGGKIMAEGTAENPIIFTNLGDDTTDPDDQPINKRGAWGGLIILGSAPINHALAQTSIEGIPTEETRGLYGGTNADDNSGVLKYVSLRHGSTNIGAGNEINGLTMGGVGRGTVISHIETFSFDDDGFEWFGGTVNSSYLASIYNQDDSFDWDFGWRGQNQFWVSYQEPAFVGSDKGFESDGAHSQNLSAAVFSKPQIYNLTLIGQGSTGNTANAMFFTEGSGGLIHNSIIMNFARGLNVTNVGATGANSQDRIASGDLLFKNNIFYQIGAATTMDYVAAADGVTTLAALKTMLEANGNVVVNPQIGGVAAGAFNPMPTAGGAAFTTSRSALPANAVDGFTYETADFIGAFGTENWMQGWTATDHYGLLN